MTVAKKEDAILGHTPPTVSTIIFDVDDTLYDVGTVSCFRLLCAGDKVVVIKTDNSTIDVGVHGSS